MLNPRSVRPGKSTDTGPNPTPHAGPEQLWLPDKVSNLRNVGPAAANGFHRQGPIRALNSTGYSQAVPSARPSRNANPGAPLV